MITTNYKNFFIIVFLTIFFITLSVYSSQKNPLDPINTSPHIYEKIIDNERVRVLKVTERNGDTALLHYHPPSIIVYLSPCGWLETDAKTNNVVMRSYKLGEVIWRNQITHGGNTSNVIQDCSRLEIELKE